jgi:hypothetical protein
MDLRGRELQEGGEYCIAEFRNLYPSPNPNQIEGMRWVRHVAHMEVNLLAPELFFKF